MLYFRAMYSDAMPFGRRPLFGFGTGDGVGVGGVPRRVFPRSALASVVIPSSSSVSMAISMTFGAAFAFSLARGRVFAASLALPPPVGRADAISSSVELLGGVSGSAPAVHPSLDPDAFASTAHSIPTRRSYRSYRRVSVDFDELFTGVGAWGGAAVAVAVAVAARAPGWSHAVTRFRSVHSFSMCSGTFASRVQRDASSAAAAAAAAADKDSHGTTRYSLSVTPVSSSIATRSRTMCLGGSSAAAVLLAPRRAGHAASASHRTCAWSARSDIPSAATDRARSTSPIHALLDVRRTHSAPRAFLLSPPP
eukprot:31303-Pelagococcus_subviridis.AAC.25